MDYTHYKAVVTIHSQQYCIVGYVALWMTDTVEPAMSSHPWDTRKVAFQDKCLLIGGSFVYKMSFWGMTKWPPMGLEMDSKKGVRYFPHFYGKLILRQYLNK